MNSWQAKGRWWIAIVIAMNCGVVVQRPCVMAQTSTAKAKKSDKTGVPPETIAPRQVAVLKGHEKDVSCVIFNPDGKSLMSGGEDGLVIGWDLKSSKEINRRHQGDFVRGIDFDNSGSWFVSSAVTPWDNGFHGAVGVFLAGRKDPWWVGATCAWSWACVALDPRGQYVVMGSLQREVKVVSLLPKRNSKGVLEPSMTAKVAPNVPNEVWRTDCHPKQPLVVAGGRDGWIRLYDLSVEGIDESKIKIAGHGPGGGVTSLKFTPDGKWLLSASHDKSIKIWNLSDGSLVRTLIPVDDIPECCAPHPQFPWLAVAYRGGVSRVVDLESGKLLGELKGHTNQVLGIAFHPDGNRLATASRDFTVRLWELGVPEGKGKKKK